MIEPDDIEPVERVWTDDEVRHLVAKRLGQAAKRLERSGVQPPPIPEEVILLRPEDHIERVWTQPELNAEIVRRLREYRKESRSAPLVEPPPQPTPPQPTPRDAFHSWHDAQRRAYMRRR